MYWTESKACHETTRPRLLQECINDTTKKTRTGGKRKLLLGQLENEGGRQEDAGDQVRQLKYIFYQPQSG